MEVSDHIHAPAALHPGEGAPSNQCTGWMSPRAGLDATEKRRMSTITTNGGLVPWSPSP
jgi:hypothetical protein